MSYWIFIFNQQPLRQEDTRKVREAVAESNFSTLCKQYHLNAKMIHPALEHLEIVDGEEAFSIFLLLHYHPKNQCPIRVYYWDSQQETGKALIHDALDEVRVFGVREKLSTATQVLAVELMETQLQDMGLLLGYEVARWAAKQGTGIIRGLDGIWYRLNRHKAFIPMDKK